jgi:hypothetical protein
MSEKKPEEVVRSLGDFEVTELDDQDLDAVAGGVTNGNCSCPGNTNPPTGFDNGNCSCAAPGGTELE